METEGLHALRKEVMFKIGVVMALVVVLVACSNNRQEVGVSPGPGVAVAKKPFFVSNTVELNKKEKVSFEYLPGDFVVGESETAFVSGIGYVEYEMLQNAFVISRRLDTSVIRVKGSLFYFYCDGFVCGYDEGTLAPNDMIGICSSQGNYYSIFTDRTLRDHWIIESRDLKTWSKTTIESKEPILLFRQDGGLFALAGKTVLRVSDASLVKELPESILISDDRAIFYAYSLDDHLVLHLSRTFENGPSQYFMTINLRDFSYKMNRSEDSIELGPYNYVAVKRADGWKVYYVGRDPKDGIKVLDPLAADGPKIVETLPGVLVP